MQVPWKQQIWLKGRGRTIRPRCFLPRSQVCKVLQDLWATATHQPPRPRKLYWDLHSILFFLPYRVGSASQHPFCPPTHTQLGAWTGTLGAGILAKSWTLGINPDPQGHSLGSSERADGWYLSQAPCDCVMLACMGRSLSHKPLGPYGAVEGPSHATPRDQYISAVSPRVHWPHGKRTQLLHTEKAHPCFIFLFP